MQIKVDVSSVMPLLFGTLLLFSGCTTMQSYEGPKLAPENVALIKGSFGMINLASILEVDGKVRGFTQESAEVLPGEHTIRVQVTHGSGVFGPQYSGNKKLSFRASAGHTYKVDGTIKKVDRFDRAIFVWIVDEKTNEVVAGERP